MLNYWKDLGVEKARNVVMRFNENTSLWFQRQHLCVFVPFFPVFFMFPSFVSGREGEQQSVFTIFLPLTILNMKIPLLRR